MDRYAARALTLGAQAATSSTPSTSGFGAGEFGPQAAASSNTGTSASGTRLIVHLRVHTSRSSTLTPNSAVGACFRGRRSCVEDEVTGVRVGRHVAGEAVGALARDHREIETVASFERLEAARVELVVAGEIGFAPHLPS